MIDVGHTEVYSVFKKYIIKKLKLLVFTTP